MAKRRVISFALKPASTSTRVLPATIRTALPVDPLPRTVSFMKRALASKKKGNVNLALNERNGYRENWVRKVMARIGPRGPIRAIFVGGSSDLEAGAINFKTIEISKRTK